MVASHVRELVDRFMREGADTDASGLEFRRSWLSGAHQEDAYNQMYAHATRYYGDLQQKQQRLQAQQAASQQQAFQQQIAQQQQQYQGMLSQMAQSYAQQAGAANQQFYTQLANVQGQYQQQLNQIDNQNKQVQQELLSQIQELSKPKYMTLDLGARQVGQEEINPLQQQYNAARSQFDQGYGLLSRFDPTGAQQYKQQFDALSSSFTPGLESYVGQANSLFNQYGGARQYSQTDVPSIMQQYQAGLQDASNRRQGVLSTLSQLGTLGQELMTRGANREAEARQSQLTYRNRWFANEASRIAEARQGQAERLGAMAVQQNRRRVGMAANPMGMTR